MKIACENQRMLFITANFMLTLMGFKERGLEYCLETQSQLVLSFIWVSLPVQSRVFAHTTQLVLQDMWVLGRSHRPEEAEDPRANRLHGRCAVVSLLACMLSPTMACSSYLHELHLPVQVQLSVLIS